MKKVEEVIQDILSNIYIKEVGDYKLLQEIGPESKVVNLFYVAISQLEQNYPEVSRDTMLEIKTEIEKLFGDVAPSRAKRIADAFVAEVYVNLPRLVLAISKYLVYPTASTKSRTIFDLENKNLDIEYRRALIESSIHKIDDDLLKTLTSMLDAETDEGILSAIIRVLAESLDPKVIPDIIKLFETPGLPVLVKWRCVNALEYMCAYPPNPLFTGDNSHDKMYDIAGEKLLIIGASDTTPSVRLFALKALYNTMPTSRPKLKDRCLEVVKNNFSHPHPFIKLAVRAGIGALQYHAYTESLIEELYDMNVESIQKIMTSHTLVLLGITLDTDKRADIADNLIAIGQRYRKSLLSNRDDYQVIPYFLRGAFALLSKPMPSQLVGMLHPRALMPAITAPLSELMLIDQDPKQLINMTMVSVRQFNYGAFEALDKNFRML